MLAEIADMLAETLPDKTAILAETLLDSVVTGFGP
jgi:hypothetical protein